MYVMYYNVIEKRGSVNIFVVFIRNCAILGNTTLLNVAM